MVTKIISLKAKDVVIGNFVTDGNVLFTVIKSEHYPQSAIARQHQKYTSALREGILVSLSFRGKPVPVIKVSDGVVRLKRVMQCETELDYGDTSTELSTFLGVIETRQPVGLHHP